MRKLKLQVQMSVDGFVCGPNGELDWMTWNWDDGLKEFTTGLNEPIDAIVMGRKMRRGFIDHWEAAAQTPDADWFSHKMVDTKKYVFSRTLDHIEGKNVTVMSDLVTEINKLKNQEGGDIIAYGGAEFVSSLIRHNLVDEYNLFINPTSLGDGMSIFRDRTNFRLVNARAFDCGIAVLVYQPQG